VEPGGIPEGVDFSMIAGEFIEVYGSQKGNIGGEPNVKAVDLLRYDHEHTNTDRWLECWDCVVTCFFLDTAHNIVAYVETIYNILKKGGVWINLGPLLYHFEGMHDEPSIELTLEEVLGVVKTFGFEIQVRGTVSPLTHPMLSVASIEPKFCAIDVYGQSQIHAHVRLQQCLFSSNKKQISEFVFGHTFSFAITMRSAGTTSSTAVFNVGGRKFEVSATLLQRFPESTLFQMVQRGHAQGESSEYFVDHNPDAFQVVLDIYRYGKLMIPPNVSADVVQLQLREFNISLDAPNETMGPSRLSGSSAHPAALLIPLPESSGQAQRPIEDASDKPPSYDSLRQNSTTQGTMSLREQIELTEMEKLKYFVDLVAPAVADAAAAGSRQVMVNFTSVPVSEKKLPESLQTPFPQRWLYLPASSCNRDVSVTFLFQAGMVARLEKLVKSRLPEVSAHVTIQEGSLRFLNDFGVLESNRSQYVQVICSIDRSALNLSHSVKN
jgi:hypothetical protein